MKSASKSSVRRPNELKIQSDHDVKQQLAALLSVVAYARDEARRLNADVLAFCLDMAFMTAQRNQFCDTSAPDSLGHPLPRGEQTRSRSDHLPPKSLDRVH